MKKIIAAAAAVLTVTLCGAAVSAHHGCGNRTYVDYSDYSDKVCVCCTEDCEFTDKNVDGVCDLCGEVCAFIDEDEDGKCDSCGKSCRFADEDGDGVCDCCGSDGKHLCHTAETSHHGGHRRGRHGHC